jgi:hypothetical protein
MDPEVAQFVDLIAQIFQMRVQLVLLEPLLHALEVGEQHIVLQLKVKGGFRQPVSGKSGRAHVRGFLSLERLVQK